jgi:hypothetical protein
MTHSRRKFRERATADQNTRDWTKEHRDEAIKQANRRAGNSQVRTLATGASFSRISSFTTGVSLDETFLTGALSQES